MSRARFLTESATPEQVARASELLAEVRRCWALAVAWEQGYLSHRLGALPVRDFQPGNPYAPEYWEAIDRYEQYRRRA
jgi:hypothetical protein